MITNSLIFLRFCPSNSTKYLKNKIKPLLNNRKIENVKASYCFFDFAPAIFLKIREANGIKNEEYLKSIGPEKVLSNLIKGNINTLSELFSTGKSGSFFYFTPDGKYTIKTIHKKEFAIFRSILKNYQEHLEKNPLSFINKYYFHKFSLLKNFKNIWLA